MTKQQIRRYLRQRKNYGLQKRLALRCGVSESLMSMWLSGDRNPEGLADCVRRMILDHQERCNAPR